MENPSNYTDKFYEKVAIITGASSGIGQATAVLFAKYRANLVLNARNENRLDETINECKNYYPDIKIVKVVGDVSNDQVCQKIVEEAIKQFDKIDILVNNAGTASQGSIENLKMEDFEKTMRVNVHAPVNLTQLCVPHLIKSKGCVINISSVCGTRSYRGYLAYCMSKSALDQFTKCTALELASKGVRVNSINPGVIITNFQKAMGFSPEEFERFLERTKRTHPMGRAGNPDEIAKSVLFLASDDAGFITGELLHVDGGHHVMGPDLN